MNDLIFRYWGKAGKQKTDNNDFHLLVYHCLDAAAAGKMLLERHTGLKRQLARALNLSEEIVCSLAVFFLAVHDLGKFSEAFQGLRADIFQRLHKREAEKSYSKRHDSLGYLAWKELAQKHKAVDSDRLTGILNNAALDTWVQAVMGHHGEPPNITNSTDEIPVRLFFTETDLEAAEAFIREAAALFLPEHDDASVYFENLFSEKKIKSASHWLAGLSVLCDWIGSGSDIFCFCREEMPLNQYWGAIALKQAEKAVNASGILPEPRSLHRCAKQLFGYVKRPTPLQEFCDTHPLPNEPQLWILEDVTGAGKTEAALILAHRLMDQGRGEGIFIGLPTMATANAMYGRMGDAYRNLFEADAHPSLILSHSARHLSEKFRQSILNEQKKTEYKPGETDASAQCNAWLADHQKKALLADVGIGTVDQALLGILPVRHQSLRLLGLMNKVLILDEVHAYDSYTQELICALLTFHASIGGSAIVLTATLTQEMKIKLAEAFLKGVAPDDEDDFDVLDFMDFGGASDTNGVDLTEEAYPLTTLITASDQGEYPVGVRESVKREVAVRMLHDETDAYRLIKKSAEQNQCVCWIRNTVADAMTAFETLKSDYGISKNSLLLFHSRYTLRDRLDIEKEVLSVFGKNDDFGKRSGRILIATQVVEQSLDLDFDVMISDLAPVDLLIQRAGRLHRHVRCQEGSLKREEGAKDERPVPVFYLLGPEPVKDAKENWFSDMFPKAAFVYPSTGQLWRTARLLKKSGSIRMPEDARGLLEGVYNDQKGEEIPDALQEKTGEAKGEEMAKGSAGQFNTLTLEQGYCSDNRNWGDDARFPTRLGAETVTVYLAKYEDSRLSPWADDDEYPWDLSSARVYTSSLSALQEDIPEELKKKIQRLQKNEKGLNKYSLILPMVQINEEEWRCDGVDDKKRSVTVIYSSSTGLLIEKRE